VIVKHYRTHPENWEGGYSRNPENDERALAVNPLPSDSITLDAFKVNGHEVSYKGKQFMLFRTDSLNRLIAFEGHNCNEIKIDGTSYVFSGKPFKSIIFSAEGEKGAGYFALLSGDGKVLLPVQVRQGRKLMVNRSDNKKVNFRMVNGQIEIDVTPEISGKRIRIEVSGKNGQN